MKNKIKIITLLVTVSLLTACPGPNSKKEDEDYYVKDTNAFNILISQYANNIEQIWGPKEVLIAGPKDYVQYEDNLRTRVHINFVSGVITIETLSDTPEINLKEAIVSTLLMPEPVEIIRRDKVSQDLSEEPFLYNQVLDQDRQPIRWSGRANSFADYLISNNMKTRNSGSHRITYVEIKLVPNHINQRARKFLPLVTQASNRYLIDERLILAIMEVESAFNPFAVSRTDALGLMQVQQHTAGRDIFKLRGKSGEPSRQYLLDPRNNVDMGTAYLSLLKTKYLAGINNPISLRYAMITSYNGGAGSVLRTFSSDRNEAINIINSMTPQQVYRKLVTSHVSQESRNYLIKVSKILDNR
ncbi:MULTISPECIES: membrane-bound lytic murein transglycosylase MltC [unclassified Gilliamella]|uniref:membrane-bound lytic murein transglycosylase MltC n=1 Tax=unclassified Gilliamella TaxID=2685620 RepID=UPI001C6A40E7|nr:MULTISPECIES: membrane-bound lytic murein transglycosylase MltC [unclassified Gilliamella]MCX8600437.1 membrane-bound lytic murein transglycosylase MltC [Gilliamella sp. B3722]MCX8609432.1 membrane-bound lytic murein transglycosylase MltC [Gilliamella sp. B3771]MCX8609651.1 membrane-bound lytic murein transglycosylase MltC [Gilliamella sp. B3891]MCX8612259.1 membrane-bound lytic murein transglycosylase MltC [Gilliamella sp. B3773]MCX8615680.1 membrane-bound lytic murein transglycosylase Mlt